MLNQCCSYLRVIILSNICKATGDKILLCIKSGQCGPHCPSALDWPTQSRPDNQSCALWFSALSHLEDKNRLKATLGSWNGPYHQLWKWFHCPSSPIIYNYGSGAWTVFTPSQPTQCRTRFSMIPSYTTRS
jgi:hypothetical protein